MPASSVVFVGSAAEVTYEPFEYAPTTAAEYEALFGATCTVGPYATDGARCGAPAVTSFTGRDGAAYHECAAHAP